MAHHTGTMADIEAWVIHADSPGTAPRTTDDATFPWAWGEAIAILPGDATQAERATALAVVSQTAHHSGRDRSDVLGFRHRDTHAWHLAGQDYLDDLHPYLAISPARNLRYVAADAGEARGHIEFDIIPASELGDS